MENELAFRLVLAATVIGFVLHRGYYTRKYGESAEDTLKERGGSPTAKLAGILGSIGLAALIVYAVQPGWISWAAMPFPFWLRSAGIVIAISGFGLLQWAQNTLGRNWSDTPRMLREQMLVVGGPYRWIRHPIYAAFMLILGSTLFVSANWLIGISWIGMTVVEITSRIDFEESLMAEFFGEQYQTYRQTTGRLLPRLQR